MLLQYGYLSETNRMLAGFCAGITEALVIVTPFEVVKIRLQQQHGVSKEAFKYKVGMVCGGRRLFGKAGRHPHPVLMSS